ncbi:hypothetical protein [Microbacterium resistens]|uniref:Gas vesicle protein n=1 Tax=Microbacterium resistens TaxID=156977 RepID=A0ABY3RXV9_9MICO|nr:hypothetical protein [Microbacterium resistens]UGS27566.1 hypothetical protein K8F61_05095 [Microbacterium resistens]
MPQDILLALIGAGGIVLGAAVTQLLGKLPSKGDATKTLVTSLHAEIERLSERVDGLTERVEQGERVGRAKDDYIHVLRQHITDGKKPPPPPYPEGLKS